MSTVPLSGEWDARREPISAREPIAAREHESVFSDLVERHSGTLLGSACRLTRNRADAEDLTQETLLRAYRHLQKVRGLDRDARVGSWLHAILKNTFISGYRRRRGRPVSVSLDHERIGLPSEAVEPAIGFVPDHEDIPREYGLSDEVRAALARLPAEYRSVLLLAVVERYKYREIALLLGCPVGTVMSRLFRARKRMVSEMSRVRLAAGPHSHPRTAASSDIPASP